MSDHFKAAIMIDIDDHPGHSDGDAFLSGIERDFEPNSSFSFIYLFTPFQFILTEDIVIYPVTP